MMTTIIIIINYVISICAQLIDMGLVYVVLKAIALIGQNGPELNGLSANIDQIYENHIWCWPFLWFSFASSERAIERFNM